MNIFYKKFSISLCAVFSVVLLTACKAGHIAIQQEQLPITAPANFRVVGYLLGEDISNGQAAKLDLSKLNYLDIFFNRADSNGKFFNIPNLTSLINSAHQHHVKIIATIGNATDTLLLTEINRPRLIDSLIISLDELQMDGIDVDLEGESINKNYEGFIIDLSIALKAHHKLITAAVATWESKQFSDKALSCFDFVNVMTYDETGPWNIKEAGPHSPYSMAVDDLDFWTNKRHLAPEKLNLGLPFYGYGFEPTVVKEFHYKKIVELYPGSENNDQVKVTDSNIIYYNGIPTIKKKTEYAMQKAGGVMIWELMEDADGEKSLLSAIDETVKGR